jgi:hypothetical protein
VVRTLAPQAPTWLVQFPALAEHQQREILQREIQGATRQRMLREIVEALETIASETPLLLVWKIFIGWILSADDILSALARGRLVNASIQWAPVESSRLAARRSMVMAHSLRRRPKGAR